MDPIGTVRRVTHGEKVSVWVRMAPGYPDDQFADTEYTCIHAADPGLVGSRCGTAFVAQAPIIGTVPGSPAALS
jgi:hypothetical protein